MKFSTPDGLAYLRQCLQPLLPYDPHDYQLEGVGQSLDGADLLAILATGSGKSAYFSMYMLACCELSRLPPVPNTPQANIPKNPGMIIVYPTVSLEEEMVSARIFFMFHDTYQ